MTATSYQRRSESPDLGAAIMRQLRGLVMRASEGDLEAIEQLRMVEAQAGVHVGLAVAGAREHAGYSWAQLAPSLGTTRGSASERFKDVQAMPVHWSRCGRACPNIGSLFLHHSRCQACQALAEDAQLVGDLL